MTEETYSVAYDFYGGMVPARGVVSGSTKRTLPTDAKHIIGFEVIISTFGPANLLMVTTPGLHVDAWLSLGKGAGKEGLGIFGSCKTGDSGSGINSLSGLNIPVTSQNLLINIWGHNMLMYPMDYHVGVVIHYTVT